MHFAKINVLMRDTKMTNVIEILQSNRDKKTSFKDKLHSPEFDIPSEYSVRTVVVHFYNGMKNNFSEEILNSKSTELAWDHTFKSAKLVKIEGHEQYVANFVILNELGMTVAYCPVKSLSMKVELKPLLTELANRHHIKRIYTDLCCEVKFELSEKCTKFDKDLFKLCVFLKKSELDIFSD